VSNGSVGCSQVGLRRDREYAQESQEEGAMGPARVQPTGVEQMLSPGELIVSKTDVKGVLTYVNHVFCRMAAASESDLIGQPHNIIRHPDMPRVVFKCLWEAISSRREIFAYVKNLALDGSHYWVFAHVTPSGRQGGPITGYHSNRRAPSRDAITAVEAIYRELRRIERSHESSRDALQASAAGLQGILDERGMTYDEFIWSVTP
jgi:PAS domain S-box-containing protein